MNVTQIQIPQRLNYPIDEGAALLGISKHTVIRDIRAGKIQVKRYGKRILISHQEILRLNQAMEVR